MLSLCIKQWLASFHTHFFRSMQWFIIPGHAATIRAVLFFLWVREHSVRTRRLLRLIAGSTYQRELSQKALFFLSSHLSLFLLRCVFCSSLGCGRKRERLHPAGAPVAAFFRANLLPIPRATFLSVNTQHARKPLCSRNARGRQDLQLCVIQHTCTIWYAMAQFPCIA